MTSHHASGKVDETGRTTGDSSHNSSGPNSSFSSVQLVFRLLLGNLDGFRFQFYALAFVGFLDGAATFFVPVLLAEYTKTDFTRDRLLHLIPLIALLYLATPCAVTSYVMADQMGADRDLAASAIALSTLLCMPVMIFLLFCLR